MGISLGGGGSEENSSRNTYGTHKPLLSNAWTTAYDNYADAISPTGANASQQTAVNWLSNNLASNDVGRATDHINSILSMGGDSFAALQDQLRPVVTAAPRQLGGQPSPGAIPSAHTNLAADPMLIDAPAGASFMEPYRDLYSRELVNPALASYDYGTDRAYSALDARTAAAGAFGNTRSGLGYSDLGAQTALGRGQLEASLLSSGLANAAALGQQDATRQFNANTANVANLINNTQFNAGLSTQNNQFNAGLLSQNNQFNANLQDSRDKFNIDATYKNDQQRLQATQMMAANIASQTGLSQRLLDNVITANGINMQSAQNLFAAGAITQSQLNALQQAAQASNGYEFTEDTYQTNNKSDSRWSLG